MEFTGDQTVILVTRKPDSVSSPARPFMRTAKVRPECMRSTTRRILTSDQTKHALSSKYRIQKWGTKPFFSGRARITSSDLIHAFMPQAFFAHYLGTRHTRKHSIDDRYEPVIWNTGRNTRGAFLSSESKSPQ
jgi:hypothetical protein